MKKLINKPDDVVTEALQGIAAAHPHLVDVHFNPNFIVRADAGIRVLKAVLNEHAIG